MISKGNHVKFARFVLLAASEEVKTCLPSFSVQCIIRVISLSSSASADNPYLNIDYSGYHKKKNHPTVVYNRIYNKTLDRDQFSPRLFVT